jgi:hypothetical protein
MFEAKHSTILQQTRIDKMKVAKVKVGQKVPATVAARSKA